MLAAHLRDQPLPEGQRLGVGVVDAEYAHPPLHPQQHDVPQRIPQRSPLGAVEVEVVDVLVLLRRVLRVLQRPVRPVHEPLGVRVEPGVVGRAVQGEIEREIDPEPPRRPQQASKSFTVPSEGSMASCPPSAAPDRPGAPGVAGAGEQRAVAALAGRDADRVDRREVEDVEAELRQARQLLGDAGEPSPRAREELIPGAEPRRAGGPRRCSAPRPARWSASGRGCAPSRRSAPDRARCRA